MDGRYSPTSNFTLADSTLAKRDFAEDMQSLRSTNWHNEVKTFAGYRVDRFVIVNWHGSTRTVINACGEVQHTTLYC